MKRSILILSLLFSVAIIFIACSKTGEYKLRPAKASEVGMQAICPVTNNVFNVDKGTKAVDYKGKTYFLCCPDCSADFQKKLGIAVSKEGRDAQAMKSMPGMKEMKPASSGEKEIMYWTCPMHPQVKEKGPGQCPICNMDLVPVYKKEGNRIGVDPANGKLLGLKNEAARVMEISKTVRLPARVAYDNDLYLSQQEYILSFKSQGGQNDILEAAKFRLTLLGYSDSDIKELDKQAGPDKTLLIPGDKAWLFVDVYENDLQSVKPGREVTVLTDTYPSTKFHGKVMFVEPSINPETRSAKARIEVDNTGGLLKLEMFASVEIKTSQGPILAVPKSAVIDTGLRKVAYVDLGNGEYEPRDVKTGFAGDDYVEIKEGLKKSELVVTNGNFMLDSESQLRGTTDKSGGSMGGMDMGGKK